jgi:hypothetical protein
MDFREKREAAEGSVRRLFHDRWWWLASMNGMVGRAKRHPIWIYFKGRVIEFHYGLEVVYGEESTTMSSF